MARSAARLKMGYYPLPESEGAKLRELLNFTGQASVSVEQVRDLLTPTYPEIATATLTGPEDTGTTLRYTFSRAIGSKA
jgi:PRTRC genetic system protein C